MDLKNVDEEINWSCWLRTILAGSGAMISLMFVGMNEAQSSVMLPQLKEADSFIRVTPNEATWIASLSLVMAPVSAMIIGPFLDAFGRKKGLQYFYLNTGLGYAVMACAREVYQIYVGRIICGLGTGLLACAVVYMVEICTTKQREYFLAITSALFASGVTLMSIISSYFPWNLASSIFSVTAFVLFIIQCFIPESPAWLFKMGEEDASIRNLQILGRRKSFILRELDTFRLLCRDDKEKIESRAFFEPAVWKPFIIMFTFFLLQSATGIVDLFFYSVDFIERLSTRYDPLDIAVMLSAARFLTCSTVVIFFRSRVGRKLAVAFSALWMSVAFVGLGAYEYVYRGVGASERSYQFLPVTFLLLYMVGSNLGMLGLPWVMSGEVYPLRMRGTMTGVTHVVAHAILFIFVKTYFIRMDAFQIYELLFIFAGFSVIAIFFAVFVLPETRNKTLLEIEREFQPKKAGG